LMLYFKSSNKEDSKIATKDNPIFGNTPLNYLPKK